MSNPSEAPGTNSGPERAPPESETNAPPRSPHGVFRELIALRGGLRSLVEAIIVGATVCVLATWSPFAAFAVVTLVILWMRVQWRVRRKVQPGERKLFENLAESLPGMVYQCRLYPTGKCVITYANSAIDWIYEKELSDMQADCRSILDLVHPDDRDDVWATLVESARNLTPWKREYRVNLPRQGTRWRFAHAKVERLSDGGTLWHGFIADVTWRKEAELNLLEAGHREAVALREAKSAAEEANILKSEFLTMVSHEIRTPLNGVIGFADLLKHLDLSPQAREYADIIHSSGERLLFLVNNTLDLTKIENGTIELNIVPIDLCESVARCFELLRPVATRKSLIYTLTVAPNVPRQIVTDAMLLEQILTNLLGNAIKFTRSGSVSLRVEVAADQINSNSHATLIFIVADTGPGIPLASQEKIFAAHFQAEGTKDQQAEGSGLGLSISRKLSQLLGGDITVKNISEAGSEFTLRITASRGNTLPG